MGTCKSASILPTTKISIEPFLYYINRSDREVNYLTSKGSEKTIAPSGLKLYKDSGIGYLNETTIFTVGGTDSNYKLKKSGYIIDCKQKTFKKITSIPMPCKHGILIPYNGYLYYVGAATLKGENFNPNNPFIGAPVMRYDIIQNNWEVFTYALSSGDIQSKETEDLEQFTLADLLNPGCFLLDSKIFYFGGHVIKPRLHPNFCVYSINLNRNNLLLEVEDFSFNWEISRPVSSSCQEYAFICGGYNELSKASISCIIFKPSKGFFEIKNISLQNIESYPPRCTSDYIIMTGFPNFAVKFKSSKGWILYNSLKNFPVRSISTPNLREKPLPPPKQLKNPTDIANLNPSSIRKTHLTTKLPSLSPRVLPKRLTSNFKVFVAKSDEVNTVKRLNNSINESLEENGLKCKDNLMISEEIKYAMIISSETDITIMIKRKFAIKIINLISEKIERVDLNAIQINQISQAFNLEVSIFEISEVLKSILCKVDYPYKRIRELLMIMYRVMAKPKLGSEKINDIIELIGINKFTEKISQEKSITLITRIIKALASNN